MPQGQGLSTSMCRGLSGDGDVGFNKLDTTCTHTNQKTSSLHESVCRNIFPVLCILLYHFHNPQSNPAAVVRNAGLPCGQIFFMYIFVCESNESWVSPASSQHVLTPLILSTTKNVFTHSLVFLWK